MAATIDETLDLLSFAGTELVNGNASPGPMASEALFALGRDEAVLPWLKGYRSSLTDRPYAFLCHRTSRLAEQLGKK